MTAKEDSASSVRAVRRVLLVTLVLNLLVAVAKVLYGTMTGALAIRADGFHSVADALNNVVALVAVSLAARPPDHDHPYGHKKHEVVAAAIIGASLLLIAVDVLRDAFERFRGEAAPPELDNAAWLVLGGTWIVNLFVATWEARAAKRYQSPALSSDAQHTRSDVLVTLAVFASVVFTRLGHPIADSLAAVGVAVFVAVAGVRVLRENFGYLSDTALVDVEQVIALAKSVPGVRHAHKVRSRGVPGNVFIDLHIHLPRDLTLEEAHEITHRAMDAIKSGIDGVADVTIHTEPDGHG